MLESLKRGFYGKRYIPKIIKGRAIIEIIQNLQECRRINDYGESRNLEF